MMLCEEVHVSSAGEKGKKMEGDWSMLLTHEPTDDEDRHEACPCIEEGKAQFLY